MCVRRTVKTQYSSLPGDIPPFVVVVASAVVVLTEPGGRSNTVVVTAEAVVTTAPVATIYGLYCHRIPTVSHPH